MRGGLRRVELGEGRVNIIVNRRRVGRRAGDDRDEGAECHHERADEKDSLDVHRSSAGKKMRRFFQNFLRFFAIIIESAAVF